MEIPALQSKVNAAAIPFDQLAGNPNVSQQDKVKEACRQFESVLLREILTEARKTVIHSSPEQDSNETGIYNDMINNQMADSISRSGAFGLAKSLENQVVRQVLPKSAETSQPMEPAAPLTKTKH